jgi:hypothetical protein
MSGEPTDETPEPIEPAFEAVDPLIRRRDRHAERRARRAGVAAAGTTPEDWSPEDWSVEIVERIARAGGNLGDVEAYEAAADYLLSGASEKRRAAILRASRRFPLLAAKVRELRGDA